MIAIEIIVINKYINLLTINNRCILYVFLLKELTSIYELIYIYNSFLELLFFINI